MTIDLKNNTIYHIDANRNKKVHKAISTSFSQIEVLNDGRILVLENYYKYENEQKSNLYCLNQNIEIEWFLPTGIDEDGVDNYVGFTTNGNQIFANTWNCFRVEIDIENGEIINKQFTK
ncbi:hypothetical protein [Flavobacterium aquicola]|uniref:Uncharacterized protein n=1 Tax=Flavobacterium aquicola TaxID=1682742 RepID=A0A3E0DVW5_9FLAO|nr:hypothetical protein [Flavobacterium aquicola]REG88754.1 hypothetical protein C8P67_1292 [Flavobacterium aquicola]